MTEVSVRELKNNLSTYLRRAEAGEEIAITRRGKTVAKLSADAAEAKPKTLDEKLEDLRAQGKIHWSGTGKFVPPARRIKLRGKGPTMSEIVLRDRR